MYIPVCTTGTRLSEMCPRSAIDCPTVSHQELQDSCRWQLRPSELRVDSVGGTAGCFLGSALRCAETTKKYQAWFVGLSNPLYAHTLGSPWTDDTSQ